MRGLALCYKLSTPPKSFSSLVLTSNGESTRLETLFYAYYASSSSGTLISSTLEGWQVASIYLHN